VEVWVRRSVLDQLHFLEIPLRRTVLLISSYVIPFFFFGVDSERTAHSFGCGQASSHYMASIVGASVIIYSGTIKLGEAAELDSTFLCVTIAD